ncbi:hypothetical protein ES703_115688 [subsurface metagenome]
MRKYHKLDVKYAVGPDTPNGNRHTLARVPVQLGLGAIFLVQYQDGPLRCRGQAGLLGQPAEFPQRPGDFLHGGPLLKAQAHRLQMPIEHIHPVALGRDGQGRLADPVTGDSAQELTGLRFYLLLLAPDKRQDVIVNHLRRGTGIARPRSGLHSHYLYLPEAKRIVQRLQRQHQPDNRAIGVGNDEALPAATFLLYLDQSCMLRVHLRDDERYVTIHAESAGV